VKNTFSFEKLDLVNSLKRVVENFSGSLLMSAKFLMKLVLLLFSFNGIIGGDYSFEEN
jgi:hypothetical protein